MYIYIYVCVCVCVFVSIGTPLISWIRTQERMTRRLEILQIEIRPEFNPRASHT